MTDTPWNLHLRIVAWSRLSAHPSPFLDPSVWRIDAHGNIVNFHEYGNRDSDYGWELDHWPTPKALGGADHPDNTRALHWRANAKLGGLLSLGMATSRRQEKGALGGLFGLLSQP